VQEVAIAKQLKGKKRGEHSRNEKRRGKFLMRKKKLLFNEEYQKI